MLKLPKSVAILFLITFSFSSFAYYKSPISNAITFAQNEIKLSGVPMICGWSDGAVCQILVANVLRRKDWQSWRSDNYSCSSESYNAFRIDAYSGSIMGREQGTVYNSLTCTTDPVPVAKPYGVPSPI